MKRPSLAVCVWHITLVLLIQFAVGIVTGDAAERTVELIRNGTSDYVIQIESGAAANSDAQLAAIELQRVVQRAAGVVLPIETRSTGRPAVRLVSDRKLPTDGFEIRVEQNDIVICGNDATVPEQPETWFVPSHGLRHGVSEFLERFLHVRWLFPGELGEDVPAARNVTVELPTRIHGEPSFLFRSLAYIGESNKGTEARPKSEVIDWMHRHRLSNAWHPRLIGFGHSWDDYLKPADMDAHPEWKSTHGVAVRNGKVSFFCTTAPGVVETFAKRVSEWLDNHPEATGASISPTDGGGFCKCERCSKLLSINPHGQVNHAGAILLFYKQVAEIVRTKHPHRRLGGFVYYNYQYPPPEIPDLPENLTLCWAPLNYYGYGLLKPVYREEFSRVAKQWSQASKHWNYHNYSTWMRSFHGAPLPVSRDIFQLELPTVAQHRAWGARMVGSSTWGANAPINYLLAKQMWSANIDIDQTFNDWLNRAYGPGWRHVRQMYDAIETRMKSHKEAQSPIYKGSQYEVNFEVLKDVYVPLFPEIEQQYLNAAKRCETETQRGRLAMLGDNLVQLHYSLRKAELLPEPTRSSFFRDDEAFEKFLKEVEGKFSLYHDDRGIYRGPVWKGEWQAPN